MMENLMTTNPFTFKTSFVGDIEIGGGEIKFNLPLTNKRLVLNMDELMMYEYLKKKGMGGMNEHEFMDKFKR